MVMDVGSPPLTKEEAASRAKCLSVQRYDLTLNFTSPAHFTGLCTATFTLHSPFQPWLDTDCTLHPALTLLSVSSPYSYRLSRIYLPMLPPGEHTVTVTYTGKYRRNGTGMHRFLDPVDQMTYIYSYFCPYFARAVFPCFDQPDLKAVLRLTVVIPGEWKAYSNVRHR